MKKATKGPAVMTGGPKLWPVAKLVPNPRNPNRHPESQIAALAKIIAHQGWRSPIVVSKRSGFIVSGHGRYEAAKLLGVKEVPVDVQEFATEADEWAHLIADNRLAELAEMDNDLLGSILKDLDGQIDIELTGFTSQDLAVITAGPSTDDQESPEGFPEVDENIDTDFKCPKCGYAWSGKQA